MEGMVYIRQGSDFSLGPMYHDGTSIFTEFTITPKVESTATLTNGFLIDVDGTVTNGLYIDNDGTMTTAIKIDGAATGIDFSGSTASTQNIILGGNGRISTGSAAGSACTIDATTSQYGEGLELRYTISDWADTYTITSAKGMYLRMESTEANASGSVYGAEVLGVANNVNTQYLWGSLVYAYVKGASAKSLTGVYAFQPEISFDAGSSTNTITDAAVVRAKVTGGVMSDYTVLDGYRLTLGDMDGGSRTYGNGLLFEDDSGMSGTCALTTGINVNISCTTGISLAGNVTDAILIGGDCSDNAIEVTGTVSDTVLKVTGTPTKVISAGSYSSMLTHQNSELITVAATDTTGWILGIGSYMRATGEDGYPFGICTLVESLDTTGTKTLQGAQFMAFLGTPGGSQAAHLKTMGGDATAGMYGAWLKVGANSNCVCDSGSRVAPLWVDNQMSGTVSGEEYGIFFTTGASKVDAVMGFETSSSGWTNFLYFDETAYDQDPVGSATISGGTQDKYLKVDVNGTAYGIPLYTGW